MWTVYTRTCFSTDEPQPWRCAQQDTKVFAAGYYWRSAALRLARTANTRSHQEIPPLRALPVQSCDRSRDPLGRCSSGGPFETAAPATQSTKPAQNIYIFTFQMEDFSSHACIEQKISRLSPGNRGFAPLDRLDHAAQVRDCHIGPSDMSLLTPTPRI